MTEKEVDEAIRVLQETRLVPEDRPRLGGAALWISGVSFLLQSVVIVLLSIGFLDRVAAADVDRDRVDCRVAWSAQITQATQSSQASSAALLGAITDAVDGLSRGEYDSFASEQMAAARAALDTTISLYASVVNERDAWLADGQPLPCPVVL